MPNEKIIEFDLNLVPQGVPPIVHIHQYDFGNVVTLKPTLYYGKELFDDDLTSYGYIIAYARPDGSKQSYVINPTIEENTIAFPLDGAMTAVWGPNVMSIGLQNGSNNSVIWTQNFILSLERHPIQSDDYIGSSAYDGMIRTLQRYVDEAYSTTPPGYEEHIRNIEEVLDTISDMRDEIEQNYNEAKEYTDEKIGGLDSVYATLDDVTQAAQEGRDYAGTLVGDIETQIVSDMSLLYTTKGEANEQEIGMQIYAEQVTEASATELRERLGIEYTEEGIDFVENGALSAEISKKANEISQTLSAEFATKEYVDGVETDTKSYAESQITQKANEITTSVRQNYESKEDASSKLAESKSYTDSSITQASGAITSAVNAYTDDTLRNLKIGAANLLRGTNEFKTEDSSQGWTPSYNNGGWEKTGTAVVSEIDDPPGSGFTNQVAMTGATLAQNDIDWFVDNKEYTAHMWIKKPIGTDPNGESYLWFRDSDTGEKIFVGYTDSEGDQIPTIEYEFHNPSHEEYRDPTDINGNFVVDENDILALDGGVTKVNVEDEDSEWIELDVHFRNKDWPEKVDVVVGDGSTNFTFAGLKIEEGTKVTSWYPNEFDFENFFSTRIIQSYDSIMQSVYGAYTKDENGNDIRTRWGSLSAYVNNVAGRVTTMANAQYITQDDLFGQESAVHSVLTNEIVSAVGDHWENLDTIAAMGSDILTKSDRTVISSWARLDMKLGGPNILRATDSATELVDNTKSIWSLDGWKKASGGDATITRITAVNPPNNNITRAWRISAAATASSGSTDVAQDEVPLSYGHEYTASCYFRVISGSGKLRLQSWKASNASHVEEIDVNSSDNSGWTRAIWTFTHDFSDYKDQSNIHFGLKNTSGTECTIEICGLKLENGNMATDWQQSVYDVEAYTEARVEVLDNAINLEVDARRLLAGSRNYCLLSDKNANVEPFSTYNFGDYNLSESLVEDQWYVISAKVTLTSPRNTVGFYLSGESMSLGGWIAAEAGTKIYSASFKAAAAHATDTAGAGYGFIRLYSSTTGGAQGSTAISGTAKCLWIKCEKVESADAPYTDWTAAPEDIGSDQIVTKINLSTSGVSISGEKVDINGNTDFTNLESTVTDSVMGSIKRLYYRTTTNSQPAAPASGATKGVTSTATTAGEWRTVIPTFVAGETFYWTCEEYKKNDEKFYYTNVSPFQATTIDGANIYTGSITTTRLESGLQNTIVQSVNKFGTSTTAAGTAAKTVTLSSGTLTSSTLATGDMVAVYFSNANTASTPTLNVNGTGAKQIRLQNGTAWSADYNWAAGSALNFTYDGTYWLLTGGAMTKVAFDKAVSAASIAGAASSDASSALTKSNKAVVESVTVYYCWDHKEPTQPSGSAITSTSTSADQWTLRLPDPVYNGYYYECTQQKLNDGTYTFTTMRRMGYNEAIAKWVSSADSTKMDGSALYAGSVDTGALNLYGELQILQSKTGSTGGYMGYETGHNGVSNTDGMLMRAGTNSSTTFDSYAWKNTYKSYLHLSDSGAIIRSPYIQLRQSGTQAVKIINDNGLNLKEYGGGYSTKSAVNSSDVLGKMAITAQSFASDDTRADLTINAKTLKFNASSNNFYFMPYTSGDTIFIQHDETCNESQIGSSSPNNVQCWSHGWFKAVGYTGLYNLSDKRSKTDITYGIDGDKIDLLKPASFRYKEGIGNDDNIHYGFIAQDVLEIYPDLVNQWCEDRYDLDYNGIIPLLVDKCQKLQKQIDNLEEALSSK